MATIAKQNKEMELPEGFKMTLFPSLYDQGKMRYGEKTTKKPGNISGKNRGCRHGNQNVVLFF